MPRSLLAPLRASSRCSFSRCSFLFAACLLPTAPAAAHVTLDAPNGGESLTPGEVFPIQWRPTPIHDTVGWALWYSTESSEGPWIPIDLEIELGVAETDAIHLLDWTVPDGDFSDVWVRVMQDNVVDQDYFDVSDASFRIAAAGLTGDFNGDGRVDAADYTVWRDGLGGAYTVGDYTDWVANFGAASAASQTASPQASGVQAMGGQTSGVQATSVPEPSIGGVVALVAAAVGGRRRRA